jgi:hypothetical protein
MLAVDTAVRIALGIIIGLVLGIPIGLLLCNDANAATPRIHIQDGQIAHAHVGPDLSGQPHGGLNPAPPENPTLCVLPDTAKFGRDDRGWLFIVRDCDPSKPPHVWRAQSPARERGI